MEPRTEISSLGEFGLIDHLTKNIEIKNVSSILGVGDDAAVIDHFGKQTVLTTDLLIENIHFDLVYTPPPFGIQIGDRQPGDIYAMNAFHSCCFLGFSNRFNWRRWMSL
jgi:thiamine-monophosphate kinase